MSIAKGSKTIHLAHFTFVVFVSGLQREPAALSAKAEVGILIGSRSWFTLALFFRPFSRNEQLSVGVAARMLFEVRGQVVFADRGTLSFKARAQSVLGGRWRLHYRSKCY